MFQYEQSIYYFIIIAQLRGLIYLHYRPENYFTKKEKKRKNRKFYITAVKVLLYFVRT